MSTNEPPKRRFRGLPLSRRRELSRKTSGTKLWIADRSLVEEFARRQRTSPAEILRDIVHDWATKKRLAGQATDTIELAGPVRKLHQDILSEQLTPVNKALATIMETLSSGTRPEPAANAHPTNQDAALVAVLQKVADELENTNKGFAQLRAFAVAHYILSGQTFAASWATLDFTQRFAEPIVRKSAAHNEESFQASILDRDDARKEGLQMVQKMALEFQYPDDYELVLILPPDREA